MSSVSLPKRGRKLDLRSRMKSLALECIRGWWTLKAYRGDTHRTRYYRINNRAYTLHDVLSGLQGLWQYLQQSLLGSLRLPPRHNARCIILRSLLAL